MDGDCWTHTLSRPTSATSPTTASSTSLPSADSQHNAALQSLCDRTANLSNDISVRLVELLTDLKNRPAGLNKLANEFLKISRILWSIETGLACEREESRKCLHIEGWELDGEQADVAVFSPGMAGVLGAQLRQTVRDFEVLDRFLIRYLEAEKGPMARLQGWWRKRFADRDLNRVMASLASARDSLEASAIVFQWSLGKWPGETPIGVGYNGLAIALDTVGNRTAGPRGNCAALRSVSDRPTPPLPDPSVRPTRAASDGVALPSASNRTDAPPLNNQELSFGSILTDAGSWIDEMTSLDTLDSQPALRIEADPRSMPRWTASDVLDGNVEVLRQALASALKAQNHRTVELVLDKGVSPDSTETHLLREAVLNHDTESLLLLLLFGADANRKDTDGVTALYSAVHVGFSEGAKVLVKYGADPNLCAGEDGESPLDLAIAQDDAALTQVLLVFGGDPNHVVGGRWVPLIRAVSSTSPARLVDLLLDYSADLGAKDDEGRTALCRAVKVDRADIVALLLDRGADPNLPGPKHVLWGATRRPRCLELLLARGADFNLAPGVLETAAARNRPESVRVLLRAGVDPNVKKDGVYAPFCTAVRDGRAGIVQILLEGGADAGSTGQKRLTRELSSRRQRDVPGGSGCVVDLVAKQVDLLALVVAQQKEIFIKFDGRIVVKGGRREVNSAHFVQGQL